VAVAAVSELGLQQPLMDQLAHGAKHLLCCCWSNLQVTYLQLGTLAITGAWRLPSPTAYNITSNRHADFSCFVASSCHSCS
jgi:hypothetical protein